MVRKGEFVESVNIKRGKEGFLVLAYGVDDEDKNRTVPKANWIYQIGTTKSTIYHPFDGGYVWVRITAKIDNSPLDPVIKRVRLEAIDKTLYIKEIKDVTKKD